MKNPAVACAVAWMALQGGAWAQPSLEATQQWITDKLAEVGAVRKSDEEWTRYEAWFEGCRFHVLQLQTLYATPERQARDPGRVLVDVAYPRLKTGSLEDIDTTSPSAWLWTIGRREMFRRSFHDWEDHKLLLGPIVVRAMAGDPAVRPAVMETVARSTRQIPSAFLHFPELDNELQHRLARAFRHAAAECVRRRAAATPGSARRPGELF